LPALLRQALQTAKADALQCGGRYWHIATLRCDAPIGSLVET